MLTTTSGSTRSRPTTGQGNTDVTRRPRSAAIECSKACHVFPSSSLRLRVIVLWLSRCRGRAGTTHRSPGRNLAVTENMAAALKKRRWLIFDALGRPVVPDVYT